MNISNALKLKNRLTGKIVKLQRSVQTYNQWEKGKSKDFDSLDLLVELQTEWAYLIDIKTKLVKANVGIAEKLVRLSEAKSELAFWTNFTQAGQAEENSMVNTFNGEKYVPVEKIVISSITSRQISEHQERVQTLIENLQDEIDNYNATTQI